LELDGDVFIEVLKPLVEVSNIEFETSFEHSLDHDCHVEEWIWKLFNHE
jgi:hypothetical protein